MTDIKAFQEALKESSKPLSEVTWSTAEVLAAACAIHREKGFTSTTTYSTYTSSDDAARTWNNKEMLTYFIVPTLAGKDYDLKFSITEQDKEQAEVIIKYFRRLTFGVIADDLNDYMSRVFKTTQNDRVKVSDFGILASVPNVYEKEVTKKQLEKEIKTTVQAYVGDIGGTVYLNIRYISCKFLPKINCFAHEAVTDQGHLVSFLNKISLGQPGTNQKIRARIKAHGVNYHTKTLETQLNYVKPLDTVLEWQ
jgi:hypothetical protein